MQTPVFVLVHSPLVGAATWTQVAERLRALGVGAVMPVLRDNGEEAGPFWQQHALSAALLLAALPRGRPLILAGHSGAGPLLPAIRRAAERDVAAYVFVDAGIPEDGRSRLDLLRSEMPEVADRFQAHLEGGGRYPAWQDQDLVETLPDPEQRARVLAEVQPRAIGFWTEPIPVDEGWPDAPCAYLQLSDAYSVPAKRARHEGWVYDRIDGGHFQMLVDPETVSEALVNLSRRAGIPFARGGVRV
jgi:hypothetical protein